jgi:hypothetical protein
VVSRGVVTAVSPSRGALTDGVGAGGSGGIGVAVSRADFLKRRPGPTSSRGGH